MACVYPSMYVDLEGIEYSDIKEQIMVKTFQTDTL